MTNKYEKNDERYVELIKQPEKKYKMKIELLNYWEVAFDEITQDISKDSPGQISVNREQGLRRSCSFTLINIDKKYLPTNNSVFWYNRKFKLYIGIYDKIEDTTYWFSQGVFVTQTANAVHNSITINAVDKFGFWNGALNTNACQITNEVRAGTNIGQFIRDTLLTDLGNGFPTDPIKPLIGDDVQNQQVLKDIVLNAGQYIGEFFITIADSLGCDVYYNRQGQLCFQRKFNDDIPTFYIYKGAIWEFDDEDVNYINPSIDYQYDGINTITVSSDNSEGQIHTYTAVNSNPASPVNVNSIGTRCDRNNPITYISMGYGSSDTCRQYAEYLLMQNTCMTINESFNTPLIPHLDVDETITITDQYFNFHQKKFLIQSLTIPFDWSEMSISAVNIQWLPTNNNSIK